MKKGIYQTKDKWIEEKQNGGGRKCGQMKTSINQRRLFGFFSILPRKWLIESEQKSKAKTYCDISYFQAIFVTFYNMYNLFHFIFNLSLFCCMQCQKCRNLAAFVWSNFLTLWIKLSFVNIYRLEIISFKEEAFSMKINDDKGMIK